MTDFSNAVWRTSTRSSGNGQCVEVAITETVVGVRDTKDQGTGPILTFTHGEWAAFLDGAGKGEFNLA